jgi:CBS domain-containing protein
MAVNARTPVEVVMSTPVRTISRDATVMEAAIRMSEHDIRSLVVTGPRAIITTTDVIDAIVDGHDVSTLRVREVMTESVETVTPDISLSEAAAMMTGLGIHHLPVVGDDGDYVGMVSATDLTAQFA